MGLETLEIRLNNRHRSYFAGQTVAGKVIVSLVERSAKIKGIKLKLTGKAKTHWKEASGRTTSTVGDNESYINEKVYLFGYDENGVDVVLEPGTVEYPFHFTLPVDLPSSFEHKYGSVKYQLEAVIVRSSKSFKYNYNAKVLFTVNGILDLNNEYEAKHEAELMKEKNVCCLFCVNGPLGFSIKLPRRGYCAGECIPFDAEVFNYSRRTILNITFSLVQEIKFSGGQHSKKKLVPISSVDGPTLEPGESKNWRQNWLPIPSIPPSRLGGCTIIDVGYFVKLKMEVKDAMTLKGQIPLIIGTIPLRANFSELTYGPRGGVQDEVDGEISQDNRDADSDSYSLILKDYPDLPPPTYEEALMSEYSYHPDSDTEDPPAYGTLKENGEEDHLNNDDGTINEMGGRKNNVPDANSVFVPKYVNYHAASSSGPAPPTTTQSTAPTAK